MHAAGGSVPTWPSRCLWPWQLNAGRRIIQPVSDFLLGVNYWPARTFVRMWREFDEREIARDFDAIAGVGLRLVRFFLFWPDFQPAPDRVDEEQLANLARVLDLAAERGLLLMPTLLVGHMSGPNWLPRWAMSQEPNNRPAVYVVDGEVSPHKPRDLYGGDDPAIFEAQRLLVRTVVERFHAHRAIWGWDLCNEISLVQRPETQAGEHWLRTLTADVHALDREHPVTAGILVSGVEGKGFRLESHALVDVASEHAYPLYDGASAGPTDVAYVGRRIEAARKAAGVPVMLTEFGMSINPQRGNATITGRLPNGLERTVALVDEGEAAAFVRDVLPVARGAGAIGALIWCHTDYDPSLYGEITFTSFPHERYFGIFDANGRLKETGEALREFAAIS